MLKAGVGVRCVPGENELWQFSSYRYVENAALQKPLISRRNLEKMT